MSTKAYYPLNEIGAGKVGFSKTRSIIEAAFYGNNVVKVNTLKEAYNLAKNSPGTIVTDMPVYRGEEFGLDSDARVLLFNDGAIDPVLAAQISQYAENVYFCSITVPSQAVTQQPDVSQANPALTVTHWTKLLWMPFTRQGSRNCIMQPFTQALTLNSW